MRPDPDPIRQALRQRLPPDASLCVAFSGGRDSTVLLHALAGLRDAGGLAVRAAHVNHGLQPDADSWEAHCGALARVLAVPFRAFRVQVRRDRGQGLEAAAREARYAALKADLRPGEWLLTAHHAEDQLETMLLHLMRGSGVAGLAGIPRESAFAAGRLCRPLLDVPAEAIAAYAAAELLPRGLHWLSDPMNADQAHDRGFLRQELAPLLRRRFPAAAGAAGRSAALAAEAAVLLDDLARMDARDAGGDPRLSLASLARLSPARQRNLIRFLARARGWPPPPERRLRQGLAELLGSAPGRQPVLRWSGREIRRYRGHLHLLDETPAAEEAASPPLDWRSASPLDLGGVRGELHLRPRQGAGLAPGLVAGGLAVAFRSGGERVRARTDRHHRTLKYLFQSRGIVPWMRGHVPLIFAGTRLAAVADLWTADWAGAGAEESGLEIVWDRHAPIQ